MSAVLMERLLASAPRFSFVALVHALESLSAQGARVGQGPFQSEAVHFRHDPGLVFHATDVASATRTGAPDADSCVEVTTTFLGLTGSASPMPPYFVEELLRAEDQAAVQRDFLDLFHHRLLALLYRGLLKYDAPRSFECTAGDRISERTLMLCGLPPERTGRDTELARTTLLRLAPLLVAYPHTAPRLSAALRDLFEDLLESAQVEVLSFTGGSVTVRDTERPQLGLDLRLGTNSVLGGSVRAPASAVCVRVGPLSPEACRQLSPGGARHEQLCGVVGLLVPSTLTVSFELSPTRCVPARLGRAHAARLGRDTWLGSSGDPAKLRFRVPPHGSA